MHETMHEKPDYDTLKPNGSDGNGGSGESIRFDEPDNPEPAPLARKTLSRKKAASRGQSLVEFALILPFIVILMAGLVDFSRAFQSYIAITNGLNEGGRLASRDPTNTAGIRQRVENELAGTGVTIVSVTVTYPAGSSSSGNPVRVTVASQVPTILGAFIGYSQISMTKYIEMIIL